MNHQPLWVVFALLTYSTLAASIPGDPANLPTAANPFGWRGDNTGRYPAATPPTTWERTSAGDRYATRGIAWMTPLPNIAVSTPIIVGEKIFLTCEPNDLVCIDKSTGKLLWIASAPEFEGLTDEERKSNEEYDKQLWPLLPQLAAANAQVVETLNAFIASARTDAPGKLPPALTKKRDIEKQILAAQKSIDKKKFEHFWAQAVFGYAGQTPVSDGRTICVFYTTGITAGYDLDGKRKWIARGAGGGSEHGNFASPILAQGKVVVWANELRAYDVESGKLAWTAPAKSSNTYGSCFKLTSGGEDVACFQSGYFVRLRDGQPIWDKQIFGDAVPTPIVEGNTIYARIGYPRNNNEARGFAAFRIPDSTDSGKLARTVEIQTEWADDELVIDKKKNPFDRDYVASPLLVDGLIYRVTQAGGLIVNDAATGEIVYRKILPLKPKTEYWNWAGVGASPALAGQLIYIFDNQGLAVIMKPGRQYEQVALNTIQELRDNGKSQAQFLASPIFESNHIYYRSPGYLYCIGGE